MKLKMKTGIDLIAKERKRQIKEEGWTEAHDDQHKNDEIARAASLYAMPEGRRDYDGVFRSPIGWPWEDSRWKPTPDDRIRELVKAGALIAAEIDRLNRVW